MQRSELDQIFFGDLDDVFFGENRRLRFAVESPVKYEVWLAYGRVPGDAEGPDARVDLILEAAKDTEESADDTDPRDTARALLDALEESGFDTEPARVAVTGDFVAANLTFAEMVTCVLPLTSMKELIDAASETDTAGIVDLLRGDPTSFEGSVKTPRYDPHRSNELTAQLRWFMKLIVAVKAGVTEDGVNLDDPGQLHDAIDGVYALFERVSRSRPTTTLRPWQQSKIAPPPEEPTPRLIERVTLNRSASIAVKRSRTTIKADAAERLFELSTRKIAWAVVDSGIDATHPAFRDWVLDPEGPDTGDPERSRIVATYDFTRVRENLSATTSQHLESKVEQGGEVPWDRIVEQGIRIDHTLALYEKDRPRSDHGTHVAGILGGDWRDRNLVGVCPDIRLYDFRVLRADGGGDEFSILAALQFIRWINDRSRRPVIHGVNLSFSIPHDVANYSCGWTPVCVEADRLVRSGVVVVAAAGNSGYLGSAYATGTEYHTMSITDPGNADRVITVGSTHRSDPHRHGVSFFSGRGPTADGRVKPDIVAPGEGIDGPIPNEQLRTMNGTSQAAPHVSGAAALLMSRYRELIGEPERVKELLLGSATDLRRDTNFQGAGLVDALRAMQRL